MNIASMTTSTYPSSKPVAGNADDAVYAAFLRRLRARFDANAAKERLFTTDADLWPVYLASFPEHLRQYHNCHACRRFIEAYGGLAVIDEHGAVSSALWHEDDSDDDHRAAVAAMARAVRRAKVTGVFLTSVRVLGQPTTGPWIHLSATAPQSAMHAKGALTAGQKMAERVQDHGNVMRALAEYKPELLAQVVDLLESDALYRAEHVIGPAKWLRDLAHAEGIHTIRTNVVWRAIASAPSGFCHPRSSMVGTLLDDIAAGKSFAEASASFAAKMHPLRYQRPQAAPAAGTIKAAEDLVEKLGIRASFARRFARLDEVVDHAVWKPAPEAPSPARGGLFGHLVPKGAMPTNIVDARGGAITWARLKEKLSGAARVEVQAPAQGAYCAFVTAEDPLAPPILQWDREDARNPVSWYLYHNGSSAQKWCLDPRAWVDVDAIVPQPHMWAGAGKHANHGEGVLFVLRGAKDSAYALGANAGNCLFPETLRAELHGIRSVVEAFSRTATLGGFAEASACGLLFGDGRGQTISVRVTTSSGTRTTYALDRWA